MWQVNNGVVLVLHFGLQAENSHKNVTGLFVVPFTPLPIVGFTNEGLGFFGQFKRDSW